MVKEQEEAEAAGAANAAALRSEATALRAQQTGLADAAADSVSKMLGRAVTPGDVDPTLRLQWGGVPTIHPMLKPDPKVYIAGDFKNLPNTLPLNRSDLDKDPSKLTAAVDSVSSKLEKLEFTPTDFNPPALSRTVPVEQLIKDGIYEEVQYYGLNFPAYEGEQAKIPQNPGELVIQLKLWKFWNYIFPFLSAEADRKAFMDQYDVSPGERTLEWTLSWPPPAHTFLEVPIIKESADPAHVQTADELVQFPRYRVWTDRVFDAEIETHSHHGHEEYEIKNIKAVPLTPQQQQLAEQIKQLEAQLPASN